MTGLHSCLFLDRDGTINVEKNFIKDPVDLELIPGAATVIREARRMNLKTIVISNQSGVARGIMTEDDVENVNARLLGMLNDEGAVIDAIYYCPHYPSNDNECSCRKPNTGMFEKAVREHNINLNQSIMVGDRMSDIEAGNRIGAATVLVMTGYGSTLLANRDKKPEGVDIVVSSLYDSMSFIEQKCKEWKKQERMW